MISDCTLLQNWEERYQRLDRSPFPKFEPVNVKGNFEPFFQSSGVPTLAFHCFDEGWNPNNPHYHSTAFTKKDSVENFLELDADLNVLASLAKYVLSGRKDKLGNGMFAFFEKREQILSYKRCNVLLFPNCSY